MITIMGGDLARYRGDRTRPAKTKPEPKPTQKELFEEDERNIELFSQYCQETIKRGERMLEQLKNEKMLDNFKSKKGKTKFIKWRNEFLKTLR